MIRPIGFGALLAVATLIAAGLLIIGTGPLFGRWGWRDVAVVVLFAEVLGLSLQALSGGPDPYLRRWDAHADPMGESPLLGTPLGPRASNMFWLMLALPPLLAAVVLLVWLVI